MLQLRDAGAGAVFVLLTGAAADATGALDDAISEDWDCSLAHDHVAALCRGNPARRWLIGALRHLAARTAECCRGDGLSLVRIGARPNRVVHALECNLPDDIDDEKYIAIPNKKELDLGKPLVLDFTREFLPDN